MRTVSLLNHCKNRGFSSVKNSSMDAEILSVPLTRFDEVLSVKATLQQESGFDARALMSFLNSQATKVEVQIECPSENGQYAPRNRTRSEIVGELARVPNPRSIAFDRNDKPNVDRRNWFRNDSRQNSQDIGTHLSSERPDSQIRQPSEGDGPHQTVFAHVCPSTWIPHANTIRRSTRI